MSLEHIHPDLWKHTFIERRNYILTEKGVTDFLFTV